MAVTPAISATSVMKVRERSNKEVVDIFFVFFYCRTNRGLVNFSNNLKGCEFTEDFVK